VKFEVLTAASVKMAVFWLKFTDVSEVLEQPPRTQPSFNYPITEHVLDKTDYAALILQFSQQISGAIITITLGVFCFRATAYTR
jgi:hypothetical protein